jgi:hypothetical protein
MNRARVVLFACAVALVSLFSPLAAEANTAATAENSDGIAAASITYSPPPSTTTQTGTRTISGLTLTGVFSVYDANGKLRTIEGKLTVSKVQQTLKYTLTKDGQGGPTSAPCTLKGTSTPYQNSGSCQLYFFTPRTGSTFSFWLYPPTVSTLKVHLEMSPRGGAARGDYSH